MTTDQVSFISSIRAQEWHPGAVHLIGFPFDGTACYRKGAVSGPEYLRLASENLEDYSPYLDKDLSQIQFIDLGDCPSRTDWQENTDYMLELLKTAHLKKDKTKLITLGGEHSISYAPIKHYLEEFSDLVLVHLDAHADLRDGYLGYHFSHASIIRRALDHFGEGHSLIQYGIRSGTQDEYVWMKENNTLCLGRQDFLKRIEEIPHDRPVYLTLDLDFFDPAFLPGTGTPEAGGEDFHCFISLMKLLAHKNFVGADVVELAPQLDPTGNSNCLAAKVVREIALCF